MKNINTSRLFIRLSAIVTTLVLTITSAFAATGVYVGSRDVNYLNTQKFEFRYYVYYNSNTATQMDIYSQVGWVFNEPDSLVFIDAFRFRATETGTGTKYDSYDVSLTYIPDVPSADEVIYPGENKRVEVPWSIVTSDTSYRKDPATDGSKVMMTFGGAGHSEMYGYSGMNAYWLDDGTFLTA